MVSQSNSIPVVKITVSGRKQTEVPVRASLIGFDVSSVAGVPRSKRWEYSFLSRKTVTSNHSDKALTTETPTPCKPPETL